MDILLEEARKIEGDARSIMQWRNDPITLQMSYHQELKVWESFWQEYLNEYFETPITPCFALLEGKRIAFLRSEKYNIDCLSGLTFNIGINLSPDMRGKGVGTTVIKVFCNWIFAKGADNIVAEVKKINIPSSRAFEKAGFQLLDEIIKEADGTPCEIYRFIKRNEICR